MIHLSTATILTEVLDIMHGILHFSKIYIVKVMMNTCNLTLILTQTIHTNNLEDKM